MIESEPQVDDGEFDPIWYLRQYKDIADLGMDPFQHYINYGKQEGRAPRPPHGSLNFRDQLIIEGLTEILFESDYYSNLYPDVKGSILTPFEHYRTFGEKEGRSPCQFFDPVFYLDNYKDVAGKLPFIHYIKWGAIELRNPSADFNASYYVHKYPDAHIHPLLHYSLKGKKEAFATQPKHQLADFLKAEVRERPPLTLNHVSLIIPVYKGLHETKDCLTSLIKDPEFSTYRVIVVNDDSPDQDLTHWLRSLRFDNLLLLENEKNLGFVLSTNRGIEAAGQDDVILLNSDTIAPPKWVSRLKSHAYISEDIASVSPVSNNATICSYPAMGNNKLAFGLNCFELDEVLSLYNCGRSVEAPTTVGFCMYIRRTVLDVIGVLDHESFRLGYGEEVDFCQRAIRGGYKHLIAWDVFVQHLGEVSFGANSASRSHGEALVSNRYPRYSRSVQIFVNIDLALPYRFAASTGAFAVSSKDTVLLISHSLGGGIEKHIEMMAVRDADKKNYVLVRPYRDGVSLSFPSEPTHPIVNFQSFEIDDVVAILQQSRIQSIEVHHQIGFANLLRVLLSKLSPIPYIVFVHDFYLICPKINLIQRSGDFYCGEPEAAECNRCISDRKSASNIDIDFWRLSNGAILRGAREVQFPSFDAQKRIMRYFPDLNTRVIPHDDVYSQRSISLTRLSQSSRMKVLLLGVLAEHKGKSTVLDVARVLQNDSFDLELIGYPENDEGELVSHGVIVSGPYREEDLKVLIEKAQPHMIWFPAKWPETYSYTLSAALRHGSPILAPRIGAFPERLDGRPYTWLYDVDAKPSELVSILREVRRQIVSGSQGKKDTTVLAMFPRPYAARILNRTRRTRRALIVPERYENGVPSPCGYIRQILPLNDLAVGLDLNLSIGNVRDALDLSPDLIFLQRNCVKDVETVERLLDLRRRVGFRIVYDIDDDLVEIDVDHPDAQEIMSKRQAVCKLLAEADVVTVSTEVLAVMVTQYRDACVVVPNALDTRLWRKGTKSDAGPDDVTKIVYIGTATHSADFNLIAPALIRLQASHGSRISIEIVGVTQDNSYPQIRRTVPDGRLGNSYPGFVDWLMSIAHWHIGIAPLLASKFNLAKSSIKTLDYAALGLVSLASDVAVYQNSLADRVGGMLIANDEQSWFEGLDFAVRNPVWRRRVYKDGRQDLLLNHTLESQREERLGAFNRLLID